MAAAGLTQSTSRQARGRWLPAGLPGAWLRAYTAIWVGTLAFAAIVAVTGPTLVILVHERARLALSPQLTPPPGAGHVLVLLALNLPVAAWPLLLGVIDAHRHRLSRRLADLLVLGCFTRNVLWVGSGTRHIRHPRCCPTFRSCRWSGRGSRSARARGSCNDAAR